MKKLLLVVAAIFIAGGTLLLSIKNEKKIITTSENGENSRGDARGMIEYFAKIMSDPSTGKLDLHSYYSAMQQVNNANSIRSTNSLGLQWEEMGPDNIGGRTRAILFDKTNPSRVFAGSVSGGLWLSTDGGQSWTKCNGSDQFASMEVCSICQDDSGYIYFGTGEGLYANYGFMGGGFPGMGVWKSKDDGNSFTQLASTVPSTVYDPANSWAEVNRLAANPNSDTIIAATEGGVMVSGDHGSTWKKAIVPTGSAATDVKFSSDGKIVYAAFTNSLYISTNGGSTFTKASGGFPTTAGAGAGITRVELAVSSNNPSYAYATLIRNTDLSVGYVVRTENGGQNWDTIGVGSGWLGYGSSGFDPAGDQGDYDLAMTIDPSDNDDLFVAGITLWRWTPAAGWAQISLYGDAEYYNELHADIHALVFDPSNSSRLLIGCDGGICQTLNPFYTGASGVQFSSLNRNYNVTQFYCMAADSAGYPMGGAQDNGSQSINGQGNDLQSANVIMGGDGGCSTIAASNNSAYFCQTPYGGLARSSNKGATFGSFYSSNLQTALSTVSAQFYTPFDLWENMDSIEYDNANNKQVRSLFAVGFNNGEIWVTPDAINFSTSPNWFELQVGTGNVTALKFSTNGNILYVGTDAGMIYRYSGFDTIFKHNRWKYPIDSTNNIVYKWNASDSGIIVTTSSYTGFNVGSVYQSITGSRIILSFAVDPNKSDSDRLIVTAGNYGSFVTYVAKSADATGAFTFSSAQGSGTNSLPRFPVYSSCITHQGDLIVGTPVGVWSSQDNGGTWAQDNSGLANVPVLSVKELIYFGSYALYAGTHGRGFFVSHTFTTGINNAKTTTSPVNNLNVFPNPLSAIGHIQYTLSKPGLVIINLYDITGKLVKAIANENMTEGTVDISFNIADLVSGTYIIDVINGNDSMTKKIVIIH